MSNKELQRLSNIQKELTMYEFSFLKDQNNKELAEKIIKLIEEFESLKSKLEQKLEKYDAESALHCPICTYDYHKSDDPVRQLQQKISHFS